MCRSTSANCLDGSVTFARSVRIKKSRLVQFQAQKKVKLPLHSASVSTPMTCTQNNVECQSTKDLISKLESPLNSDYVRALIHKASKSLQLEFFDDSLTPELAQLHSRVQSATHSELLAVFFLLLNVDQGLKQIVYDLDVPDNHAKITRFIMDLRQQLVTTFFCSSQTLTEFVQECSDTYCIS
jgi:hypothetical protein